MGSNSDDANATRTPDDPECELSGIEDLVGRVSDKMRCSLPQARLSIDATLAAIKETPKPLRIAGFGVFDHKGFRWFK